MLSAGLGAPLGALGGLKAGVGLDGVAEGAGLAHAVGEGLVGALGVVQGREVGEAVDAVGVEDARLARPPLAGVFEAAGLSAAGEGGDDRARMCHPVLGSTFGKACRAMRGEPDGNGERLLDFALLAVLVALLALFARDA